MILQDFSMILEDFSKGSVGGWCKLFRGWFRVFFHDFSVKVQECSGMFRSVKAHVKQMGRSVQERLGLSRSFQDFQGCGLSFDTAALYRAF